MFSFLSHISKGHRLLCWKIDPCIFISTLVSHRVVLGTWTLRWLTRETPPVFKSLPLTNVSSHARYGLSKTRRSTDGQCRWGFTEIFPLLWRVIPKSTIFGNTYVRQRGQTTQRGHVSYVKPRFCVGWLKTVPDNLLVSVGNVCNYVSM